MHAPLNNQGHGHVYPRADGFKARCGGPSLCKECAQDLRKKYLEAYPVTGGIKSFDPVRDVKEFHEAMQIAYDGKPRMIDPQLFHFRLKFLREETQEYEKHGDQALFCLEEDFLHRDQADLTHHMAEQLDALVDLVYVALGTAYLHGYDFRQAWQRVHEANMRKQPSPHANTAEERIKMKVTKPKGWEPPCHDDLVEDNAHGHR